MESPFRGQRELVTAGAEGAVFDVTADWGAAITLASLKSRPAPAILRTPESFWNPSSLFFLAPMRNSIQRQKLEEISALVNARSQ